MVRPVPLLRDIKFSLEVVIESCVCFDRPFLQGSLSIKQVIFSIKQVILCFLPILQRIGKILSR